MSACKCRLWWIKTTARAGTDLSKLHIQYQTAGHHLLNQPRLSVRNAPYCCFHFVSDRNHRPVACRVALQTWPAVHGWLLWSDTSSERLNAHKTARTAALHSAKTQASIKHNNERRGSCELWCCSSQRCSICSVCYSDMLNLNNGRAVNEAPHRSSSSRSASGSRWGRKGRRAAAPQVKWRETRQGWSWASLPPSRSTGAAAGAPRLAPAPPPTDPYLTGPGRTGEVGKRRPTIPIPTGSAGRLETDGGPFSERDRAPHVAVPRVDWPNGFRPIQGGRLLQ